MIVQEIDLIGVTVLEAEDDAPLALTVIDQRPFRSPFNRCRRKLGRSRSCATAASSSAARMVVMRSTRSAASLLRSSAS